MTFITYIDKRFRGDALEIIETTNDIVREYRRQGFDLTLRQLYYQFVSRDLLPNNDKSYKRLGSIVNDGRLAGLISWSGLVDRTRSVKGDLSGHEETPEELIRGAASSYFEDLWRNQPRRVEVWVEKEALAGVVQRAAGGLRAPHFSCRGYVSQTAMWDAGQRMQGYFEEGKIPLVLHLGDHDPSGIDMTRDIQDRLEMFAGRSVRVHRIALNMDQIEEYAPPPNPAKITDSRAVDYIKKFGRQSWELDALEPTMLVDLIRSEIRAVMDDYQWEMDVEAERNEREKVVAIADRWAEITAYLEEN